MNRKTVYLAGPISGCTKGEANDWRDGACARLAGAGITGISPLRCEPLVGERYGTDYPDPRFGIPRAIASKNIFDVRNCDMTLAYFPPEEGVSGINLGKSTYFTEDGLEDGTLNQHYFKWPSVGTVWELGLAGMAGKPTIVVCQNTILIKHPVIQAASSWLLTDLEEGLDVAIGVLQDYAEGNRGQRNG